MWSPFRRTRSPAPFPAPAWPPIQNPDQIDLTAARQDGGVDLLLVASQPLDDSPETLASLRRKFATYLATIDSDDFQTEQSHPSRDRTAIVVVCEHPIHPAALAVIEECRVESAIHGVRFQLRTSRS